MPRPPLLAAALALAVLSAAPAARAAVTLSESFVDPGASLGARTGGTGFSGPWADNTTPPSNGVNPGGYGSGISGNVALSNDATSLSFPNLTSAGARVLDTDGGFASRNTAAGSGAPDLTTTNTYYLSALIRGSGVVQFDNSSFSIAAFGIKGGQFVSAIRDISPAATANYNGVAGTYNASTTYLMVAKIVGGSTDTMSVKIYDPTMAVPTTEPATFDLTSSVGSSQAASRLSIVSFAGVSNEIDEIRAGSTWADVVPAAAPEPGTGALLTIASLAPLARRRRRRLS